MADLYEVLSQLEYLTQRVGDVEARLTVSCRWRYRVSAIRRDLDPPVERVVVDTTVTAIHETTAYLMAHNGLYPGDLARQPGVELREDLHEEAQLV